MESKSRSRSVGVEGSRGRMEGNEYEYIYKKHDKGQKPSN